MEHTITEIAEETKTNKTKIRRIIDELEIKAVNETTRKHKNSPKMYDKRAKIAILSKITSETSKRNNAEQNQNSAEHEQNEETQEEIINILKKQLDRAYEEKKELTRALNKAQQLVNQQQQLTLSTNNELKILKIELKEKKKKKRFFNIFHTKE